MASFLVFMGYEFPDPPRSRASFLQSETKPTLSVSGDGVRRALICPQSDLPQSYDNRMLIFYNNHQRVGE